MGNEIEIQEGGCTPLRFAQLIGRSHAYVNQKIAAGDIPVVVYGPRVRLIPKAWVEAHLSPERVSL